MGALRQLYFLHLWCQWLTYSLCMAKMAVRFCPDAQAAVTQLVEYHFGKVEVRRANRRSGSIGFHGVNGNISPSYGEDPGSTPGESYFSYN